MDLHSYVLFLHFSLKCPAINMVTTNATTVLIQKPWKRASIHASKLRTVYSLEKSSAYETHLIHNLPKTFWSNVPNFETPKFSAMHYHMGPCTLWLQCSVLSILLLKDQLHWSVTAGNHFPVIGQQRSTPVAMDCCTYAKRLRGDGVVGGLWQG